MNHFLSFQIAILTSKLAFWGETQVNYMKELYDKTYILSGERLGRIMVQSVQDQGGWMDGEDVVK